MPYAESTSVTPDRTQAQISETLRKYGASGFMYGWEDNTAVVAFKAHDRHIRFNLPLPNPEDREFRISPAGRTRTHEASKSAYEQALRTRWRALLLAIKAKLEAVETGITTFESEFMAHIVMPDGHTVADHVLPRIQEAYESGGMPPTLLPGTDYQRQIEG